MTKLKSYLVEYHGRLAWQVCVMAKSLTWFDVENLWVGKAASPEYVQRVSGREYGNENYEYDKTWYGDVEVLEEVRSTEW